MLCNSLHSKYKDELGKNLTNVRTNPPRYTKSTHDFIERDFSKLIASTVDKQMLDDIRCTASIYIEEKEALKEHLGNKYSIITEMNCFTLVHEFLGVFKLDVHRFEELYSRLILSPDLVPLDPGDYVDISDGAGAVVASPQVSEVEPEDAGVGPHGGDVRADPEPQSSVGESEVEIGVKRGHQKEADAHQELYAPEGDDHVKGEDEEGAHQELYAPESEVTTEGEEIVGEVPHVGGEAELPAEELYAPVGESIPDVGIEEGVDEGLETELIEKVGLVGHLPGHVMVLLAAEH